MLFDNKKCEKCGSEYDVALPTCPDCGAPEKAYAKRKIPTSIFWLEYWKEIVIFLIGSFGISIIATFCSALLSNSTFDALRINFMSYAFVLLIFFRLLSKDLIRVKPQFKQLYLFLIGAVGAIALYLFSVIYSSIVLNIHPMEPNANEVTADNFIVDFPMASFWVIVFFGPICEELTYRVGLFSFLYRVKPFLAYLVTIILFALIHFDTKSLGNNDALLNEMLNLPFYLFAGATFCFLYYKWGLAASLTAHVSNNLLTFILVTARAQ